MQDTRDPFLYSTASLAQSLTHGSLLRACRTERRTLFVTARAAQNGAHDSLLHVPQFLSAASSLSSVFFHLCIHSSELTRVDCITAWRCYCDIGGVKDMSKVNPTVARIPPKWYLDVFLPDGQSPLRMEVTAKTAIGTHCIVGSRSTPKSPCFFLVATH